MDGAARNARLEGAGTVNKAEKRTGARSAPVLLCFFESGLNRSDVADRRDHDGLDRVHAVFGLVENLGVGGEKDLVRDLADIIAELLLRSGHRGVEVVEGGQAVQENAVGILRSLEHLARDLVGGEQLDALGDLVLFAHGSPNIGVEGVRALEKRSVLTVLHDGTGLLADLAAVFDDVSGGRELLRAPADIVDAELSADVHQAVGDVVARVAAEDELALAQRLFGVLHQREDVGKRLRRVVDVGQAVPHTGTPALAARPSTTFWS